MTPISDRMNDRGSIVAGLTVSLLIASLLLAACGGCVSAFARFAAREKAVFLAEIAAHNREAVSAHEIP